MTLPSVYTALPFNAANGIPQTVPYDIGARRLRVTIVASATDLPALVQTSRTEQLFDLVDWGTTPRTGIPASDDERFIAPAQSTLAPAVVCPRLVVRDGETIIGSLRVRPRRPLRFGRTEPGALAVEIYIETLCLAAGSLVQPGELGATIVAGIRPVTAGVTRFESMPVVSGADSDWQELV